MENAVQALKMGAAILVFSIALVTAFMVFAQARQVAETVFIVSDNDRYKEYVEGDVDSINRIVGIETIIPTLYNYAEERYSVTILDSAGNQVERFDIDYNGPMSANDIQKRLNTFVSEELLSTTWKNRKFRETIVEDEYKGSSYTDPITGETIEAIGTETKLYITYQAI